MAKDDKEKLKRKVYEKQLRKLQVELCYLQDWIKATGERVIIVLEGRDAAGKGGLIKAITARVSPRVFRVFALPAPTDRDRTQMYIQRYMQHFPAGGEIVIFDRSWYNRAGVEAVMGFCTREQHELFLQNCPIAEHFIVNGGIRLLKLWLEVEPSMDVAVTVMASSSLTPSRARNRYAFSSSSRTAYCAKPSGSTCAVPPVTSRLSSG